MLDKVITSEKEATETLDRIFTESVRELINKDSHSSCISEKSTLDDSLVG